MMRSGCEKVWANFAAIFDQQTPLEHDVFGDRENALLEHRPNLVCEPIVEFGATIGVRDKFDTEPDFREGHRTRIEQFKRLGCHELVPRLSDYDSLEVTG
jgi:hypothetical protein